MLSLRTSFALALFVALSLMFDDAYQRHRVTALERQLAPAAHTTAAVKVGLAGRTFKASNGVVLSPDDIAQLETQSRQVDKMFAEMEWIDQNAKSQRTNRAGPYKR